MNCPKCKKETFVEGILADSLAVKNCVECKGTWIPAYEYEVWQEQQPHYPVAPAAVSQNLDVNFVQSPYDTKAALCPECSRYLSRAKVNLKTPFYVERCANCGGIWCDRGEWDVLQHLGLHTTIQQMFTSEWQAQVQQRQHIEKEREAIIERFGSELAALLFEVAESLEKHPYRDFAVAYLMRRVSK